MTYWKIQFDEGLEGYGWLQFNEAMEAVGLFDTDGNPVTVAVGYHPIEFDTQPEWV